MKLLKFLLVLCSSTTFCQQIKYVDFKNVNASITIDFDARKVSGAGSYEFDVIKVTDTISIDAVRMTFTNVRLNGKAVKFVTTSKGLKLFTGIKKGKNKLSFSYEAFPRQTMYFVGQDGNRQIWTQGQGKNTSHWLPSFNDVNEKAVFGLTITYDRNFEVISNGLLTSKEELNSGELIWNYQMKHPMSSYLVMLAVGKFDALRLSSASKVPLVLYYQPEDLVKSGWTYKYSKEIFDGLEKEIGVPYPWGIYRQVPVRDFLYAGMENTAATVFSQDFVVDETGFNDRDYINVNAHELAHQWFGDMVTASSGKHHWLQEGFATYYALLAEKQLFGNDHFNHQMYSMAMELEAASAADTIPILNEKASSLTFYKKGAWALHVLREEVGEEDFRKAVQIYLKKHAFKNVSTGDFLDEIKDISAFDPADFKKEWLETGGFRMNDAVSILRKNSSVAQLLAIKAMSSKPLSEKSGYFKEILASSAHAASKEEIIYQIHEIPFEEKKELISLAMQTNNIHVRLAVAKTISKIPPDAYGLFSSLLDDKSYITQEIAFNLLFVQFPEKRSELLDKLENVTGFNDKNIRILWLTFALAAENYRNSDKVRFYDELLSYTTPDYESSIRQNALEKLLYLNPNDKNVLLQLISPLTHHKWQFSKFARDQIRELLKTEIYRQFFTGLLPTLAEDQKAVLQRLLDEK